MVILDRAPAITAPKDRPLHLHSSGLQIEAAADYLRQKPWWEKWDPLRPLLAEEVLAAQAAEEVTRAINSLERGEGTSRAAEVRPKTLSEEEGRRREGKAPVSSDDLSELESLDSDDMDDQPLEPRKRRRTGPTVMGSGEFALRPMPGVLIREPAAGRGRVPRSTWGPPPPTQPPPPIPSPPRTPPPLADMEVDQRTPDPKGGVPEAVSNKRSVAELPEVVVKVAEEAATTGDEAPRGFTDEIQREVDALTSEPLGGAEEAQAGRATTEPDKADEVPSTSFPSFKSFQSGDMGFSAKKCSIPDGIRAEIWGRHRESAEAYFGGCSKLSEMKQVREWSIRATAGIAEPGPSVPDPARDNQRLLMQVCNKILPLQYFQFIPLVNNNNLNFILAPQVIYNHTLTCEMIDTLQGRVDIAETEAKLAQLKQEKAEHKAKVVIDSFNTFCNEMEKDILPQIDEGEALLKAFGAVDVPNLKAKIQHKIDAEVQSQGLAREEISQ
ncbi:uncharacterized protein LOC110709245 [Chenopodium quinoa]|uniref:uncharacterized protein LOC110709245 n=1 Tax=Chenopodium quinoa TaxID=63459 RepID=UPI000B77543B|nr:uncharacterized protein LOC110709245 [Chenopodium quinoa]